MRLNYRYRWVMISSAPPLVPLILCSYRHWTGEDLIPAGMEEAKQERALWELPRVVVAHNTAKDPCFMYGNQAALKLFEMRPEDFIGLPSRLSSEPLHRDERSRLLEEVSTHGFTRSYSGVRISSTGKRFRIEEATVWNLVDPSGICHGQAATFAQWTRLCTCIEK